jgi:hypothetical protein
MRSHLAYSSRRLYPKKAWIPAKGKNDAARDEEMHDDTAISACPGAKQGVIMYCNNPGPLEELEISETYRKGADVCETCKAMEKKGDEEGEKKVERRGPLMGRVKSWKGDVKK